MPSKHVTLTANSVTTVTFPMNYSHAEVVNRDGAAEVYFTVNGAAPTVAGDDTLFLPAAISGLEFGVGGGTPSTTFQFISAGSPRVTVRAW